MKTLVFLALLCAGSVHADDFYALGPVKIGTEQLVTAGEYTIHCANITLHCDLEPVVKKEGDGWVITFKPKAEGK